MQPDTLEYKISRVPHSGISPAQRHPPMPSPLLPLLLSFSWQEFRHHPWRNAAAVGAVMLGVALAFGVHLINASALQEFAAATASVGGKPDLTLRRAQGLLDEALMADLAHEPGVALASPVLELAAQAAAPGAPAQTLRVLGLDALVIGALSPALLPHPGAAAVRAGESADDPRLMSLHPDVLFLNPAARRLLGEPDTLTLGVGALSRTLRVAGHVGAGGAPLAVMDLGALQDLAQRWGQLSWIDLRLTPGADAAAMGRTLATLAGRTGVLATVPADTEQRVDQLSRAYRANLTALALVALFTGAFLVFSVLSLSVARRAPQLALLAVLGLTPAQRLRLVLAESALLGLLGSGAGLALGAAVATLALQQLGGDLGGGYFAGSRPTLHWSGGAAAGFGTLGVLAALAGGGGPAHRAAHLPPAQTLKGQGLPHPAPARPWAGLFLIATAVLLTRTPALFGLPLAAYGSVALLLLGGMAVLPWLMRVGLALYNGSGHWLTQLALERARRDSDGAATAVGGVVAALSLAVALTVMVASFRGSVLQWLDVVLPADLYVRSAGTPVQGSAGLLDNAWLGHDWADAVAALPGVNRVNRQRQRSLLLDPARPPLMLVARDLPDPSHDLPLVGALAQVAPGHIGVWVSEAVADLYGVHPGERFAALEQALRAPAAVLPADFEQKQERVRMRRSFDAINLEANQPRFVVAGVWRDYARQSGTVVIERHAYERLTGDTRVSDLALWLQDDADLATVQQGVRALAAGLGQPPQRARTLEFSQAAQVRAQSLRIFDRSFAVTWWLQGVAIGIGLFGVAASFSAQVLARRKEFGLLAHLGLTRPQILALVAAEGAVQTAVGALAGLLLGLAVAGVLVHVVNPQSFHWTMDLVLPWPHLGGLCAAVVVTGTLTVWLSAQAAAGRDAVLAVKEDW